MLIGFIKQIINFYLGYSPVSYFASARHLNKDNLKALTAEHKRLKDRIYHINESSNSDCGKGPLHIPKSERFRTRAKLKWHDL